jgi:hypothetical protein
MIAIQSEMDEYHRSDFPAGAKRGLSCNVIATPMANTRKAAAASETSAGAISRFISGHPPSPND